jgi:hypothetical protein
MKLTLDISVKPERGLPLMFLSAEKDGKVLDLKYDPALTISDLFEKFEGVTGEKQETVTMPIRLQSSMPRTDELASSQEKEEPLKTQPKVGDFNPEEIQREDLIQIQNVMSGLKDASGNELSKREGIKQGGVYRVLKINQNIITTPDPQNPEGEPIMTKIVNSYEVIDDKAPRPERLSVFPSECVLFKKREKKISIVKPVFSEFLKCPNCGEVNALVLKGNKFEGSCGKCGEKNSIERVIELCPNEKCVDAGKARSKVACYLYEGKFVGTCGNCKTSVEKELAA